MLSAGGSHLHAAFSHLADRGGAEGPADQIGAAGDHQAADKAGTEGHRGLCGERVDELAAKVSVADLDGDGSNELVVGTSERQLAAYNDQGRQLWCKTYPGDILKMDTADMHGDGKSEAIAYLMTETLHQVKADGSEGPVGDVLQAERDNNNGYWGVAGAFAMAIWAPDGEKKKEAQLFTEGSYGVQADGAVKPRGRMGLPRGAGRLVNMYPHEPEVLVTVGGRGVELWSARRDKEGKYTHWAETPGRRSGRRQVGVGWAG